jgi:tRNA A-37 threonylcarbamoyl transferase component Bud32/Tol biopolymer transport system component
MPLTPGSRLGPYEILAPLGAGGMGEVYKARDTRLGRDVVIKTLRPEVASDAGRLRRFEQEARAASALNHPNIVTIHDIGSQEGTLYIAMELVEGATLRELLAADEPLPIRKTLELATQIAEGLGSAHAAGIVHRDLKPENVIVSKDGFVKILDFGLAKLAALSPEEGSEVPTVAAPETHPGTVMGTVGYMSPEQSSGRPLDYRSDQFSFGSVVYEMATGKRAFRRKTHAETLTAIIREEPEPVAQANPKAPAPLRWILERCLAKDPEDRYTSTRDLARDLRSIRDHLSETSVGAESGAATVTTPVRRTRVTRWLPLSAAAAVAALVLGYFLGTRTEDPPPTFRQLTFRRGTVLTARFTPDGQTVVYSAAWEGKPVEIFSARIGSPESRPFGIPGASLLAVSSTGELAVSLGWRYVLGWEGRGTLARVPLAGGAPRQVLEGVQDADWSPDGANLAVVRQVGEARVLEYPIGRRLYQASGWLSQPRVSPKGDTVAVFEHPILGDNWGRIVLMETSGKSRILTPVGPYGYFGWSADGADLWVTEAQNLLRISTDGLRQTVLQLPVNGVVQDVSRDGKLLVGLTPYRREIVGLASGDERERNLAWLNWSWPIDLSADGRLLLFEEQNLGPEYALYIRKTDGSDAVRLGTGRGLALSPDGQWALAAAPNATDQLILIPTGAGEPRLLPKAGIRYQPQANFFPDGRRVLVQGNEPGRGIRLFVQPLDGTPRPISPEGVNFGRWQALSPDGVRVAAIGPDARIALYSVEPGKPRRIAGLEPGELPIRWTPDGRTLYVAGRAGAMATISLLDVETGERTTWKTLDPPDPAGILSVGPFFISEDGKSYAYSYRREVGDLFLVEGLR